LDWLRYTWRIALGLLCSFTAFNLTCVYLRFSFESSALIGLESLEHQLRVTEMRAYLSAGMALALQFLAFWLLFVNHRPSHETGATSTMASLPENRRHSWKTYALCLAGSVLCLVLYSWLALYIFGRSNPLKGVQDSMYRIVAELL
jgi:hypothetical protein